MINFETSRFGRYEVEEDRVISFPEGIMGFQDLKRFIIIDHKDSPLKWLQAVDDPDVAFIVSSPDLIVEDYNIEPDKAVREYLDIENDEDLAVVIIMRVEGEDVKANFAGPILINARLMKGIQIALERHPYQKVI